MVPNSTIRKANIVAVLVTRGNMSPVQRKKTVYKYLAGRRRCGVNPPRTISGRTWYTPGSHQVSSNTN